MFDEVCVPILLPSFYHRRSLASNFSLNPLSSYEPRHLADGYPRRWTRNKTYFLGKAKFLIYLWKSPLLGRLNAISTL